MTTTTCSGVVNCLVYFGFTGVVVNLYRIYRGFTEIYWRRCSGFTGSDLPDLPDLPDLLASL